MQAANFWLHMSSLIIYSDIWQKVRVCFQRFIYDLKIDFGKKRGWYLIGWYFPPPLSFSFTKFWRTKQDINNFLWKYPPFFGVQTVLEAVRWGYSVPAPDLRATADKDYSKNKYLLNLLNFYLIISDPRTAPRTRPRSRPPPRPLWACQGACRGRDRPPGSY